MVHEEIPLKSDIQYVITPGPAQNGARGGAYYEEPTGKNALVVFCVDTSGSMGVTSEVYIYIVLKAYNTNYTRMLKKQLQIA